MAFANDGVAGVPGTLRVVTETPDGTVRAGGGLDAGHPHGGRLRQASLLRAARARRAARCACARRSRPRACAGRCTGRALSRWRRTGRSPSGCWPRTTPSGGRESDDRHSARAVRGLTFTAVLAIAGAAARRRTRRRPRCFQRARRSAPSPVRGSRRTCATSSTVAWAQDDARRASVRDGPHGSRPPGPAQGAAGAGARRHRRPARDEDAAECARHRHRSPWTATGSRRSSSRACPGCT